MKPVLIAIAASILLNAACTTRSLFVQDDISIQLPVRQEMDGEGHFKISSYNDGGTKMIRITDAQNRAFEVYEDHRLGFEKSEGTYYLNGYPDSVNSIKILGTEKFKRTVLKDLVF